MAKRAPVKRQITQAGLALRGVMQTNLAGIAEGMINQIMGRLARLPEAQRLNAVKELSRPGAAEYKGALLAALAVVAGESLDAVRKEVPKAKAVQLTEKIDSIRLGEFDDLPAGIRKKVFNLYQILYGTQLDDLEKNIVFQFSHSVDSTDSLDLIRADLEDAAYEYTTGNAILAGANSIAGQVINETRNSFFDDPEVQDEIDAFEFVNEDPVSAICQDLAGSIFEANDPDRFRYTPPLHFNCKSWIRPILKGNLGNKEITGIKPSTKKLESSIQFAEQLCGCGVLDVKVVEG